MIDRIPRISGRRPIEVLLAFASPTSSRSSCSKPFRMVPLYSRYTQLRSYADSPFTPPTTPISATTSSHSDLRSQFSDAPPTPAPKVRRSLRPYIYATVFLLLGMTAGQYVTYVLAPPALPLPGTKEDEALVGYIHSLANKLPLVESLSTDPNWRSWDAYSAFTAEERPHRITTGPLGGSRGLGGYQRVFYNEETGQFVSVVWIGGGVAGWPGVTHGGLIATLLDESLGRCAIARFPSKTGVTANLELNYRAPTVTNSFYVVRAVPVLEGATERKMWVSGRLETIDGRVCVESKGLFVVPKQLKTRVLEEGF